MEPGQLFVKKYYENGKLLKEKEIRFIGETKDTYVFGFQYKHKPILIHVGKSNFPTHKWKVSPTIFAFSIITPK